jgi:hypothetical protein
MMFLDIVVRISSLSIPKVCPAIGEDVAPGIPSAMYMGPGVLGIVARVSGSMFRALWFLVRFPGLLL